MTSYDYAIIGGGIVGLSTAWHLGKKSPGARILVVEKEDHWAAHQTGHNSGVIHSGIYYKPGSLKAKMARAGSHSMVEFCQEHRIAHDVCGKVIVACDPQEMPSFERLYQRGLENGLDLRKLSREEVKEIEPHVECLAGIRVPTTGIADFKAVTETLARLVREAGGELKLNTKVCALYSYPDKTVLETTSGDYEANLVINCAGLHSDRVAKMGGCDPKAKIVPFRGEYYELKPEKRHLVKHLIYPVPNPEFPFLGVHFTRMTDGNVHAGPNAVLSFKREGYQKSDFSLKDLAEVLAFPGFWRMVSKNAREGFKEMVRSFSKAAFVRSLQRLIPEIQSGDLQPTHAGVRAQALMPNGQLVDDFLIVEQPHAIHICNAPSPAATASLEIGNTVADKILSSYPDQQKITV